MFPLLIRSRLQTDWLWNNPSCNPDAVRMHACIVVPGIECIIVHHICTQIYTHAYIYIDTYTYLCIYMYIYRNAHTGDIHIYNRCMYVSLSLSLSLYIYIHMYTWDVDAWSLSVSIKLRPRVCNCFPRKTFASFLFYLASLWWCILSGRKSAAAHIHTGAIYYGSVCPFIYVSVPGRSPGFSTPDTCMVRSRAGYCMPRAVIRQFIDICICAWQLLRIECGRQIYAADRLAAHGR
jgi:hypothetical protein